MTLAPIFKNGYLDRTRAEPTPPNGRISREQQALQSVFEREVLSACRDLLSTGEGHIYIGRIIIIIDTGKEKVRFFHKPPFPIFDDHAIKMTGSLSGFVDGYSCTALLKKIKRYNYEFIRADFGKTTYFSKCYTDISKRKRFLPGVVHSAFLIRIPEISLPLKITQHQGETLSRYLETVKVDLFDHGALKERFSIFSSLIVTYTTLQRNRLFTLSLSNEKFWLTTGSRPKAKLVPLCFLKEFPSEVNQEAMVNLFSKYREIKQNFSCKPGRLPPETREMLNLLTSIFKQYEETGRVDVEIYRKIFGQYLKILSFNLGVFAVNLFSLSPTIAEFFSFQVNQEPSYISGLDQNKLVSRLRSGGLPSLMGEEKFCHFVEMLLSLLHSDPEKRPTPEEMYDWGSEFLFHFHEWNEDFWKKPS